jgi:peptidoglycan-associated lipoprotein
MKSAKLLNVLVAGVLLATFASGCKKQPKNITSIPANQARPGGGQMSDAIDPNARLSQEGPLRGGELPGAMENSTRDTATLSAQTSYFDFDRSAIQPSEQGKLDAVATFLKSTEGVQVLVEGHCDERGTEEYNRSLGERRAIAAREYLLQKHGISSERITTASFGEDRPVSVEKTEEAYARNRRAEFVVLRPQ